MVVNIADLDKLRGRRRHERSRLGLEHARNCVPGDDIAIGARVWHNVQQQHGYAGVRDLSRDPAAHRSRTDDADLADLIGHYARSRTVAMPWPPPMHWVASA